MSVYTVEKYSGVVEGLEKGTWCVNKTTKTDLIFEIDSNTAVKDICQFLKKSGVLESADLRKVIVSNLDSDIIEFKLKKENYPVCRLVRRLY